MMTPTVPTTKDHSTVLVLQDTLEMESLVLVMTAYLIALLIIPLLFRMKHHHESNKTSRKLIHEKKPLPKDVELKLQLGVTLKD